jgi:HEAT repeat protein
MRYLLCGVLLLARYASPATSPSVGAWETLTRGAAEDSAMKRAAAVAALGTIRTARAEKLVEAAVSDKDSTVRLTAVSALAERKSRSAIPKLKVALEDDAAEVSFSAAKALWEMGDRSGRDLLVAVLAGDQKQSPGYIKKSLKDAKATLRNRKALVWMGAKEGAGFLFGPLGYGLGVVEELTKDAGSGARALSAALLAQDKDPIVIDELTDALWDKSPLVRAAAAKALGGFANRGLSAKIEPLLEDKQDIVRFMAAASIVRLAGTKAAAR